MERKIIELEDDSQQLFIEPIPRWITRQGFFLMVFIFLILIISSFLVKYPQTITVEIYISKDSIYSHIPFDTYSNIKTSESVRISTPFHNEDIIGELQSRKAWAEGKNMVVPLKLRLKDKEKLKYDTNIICPGEIIISNKSIMSTIIQN